MKNLLKILAVPVTMAIVLMACQEDAVLNQQDIDILGEAASGTIVDTVQLGLPGGPDAVDADGNVTVSRNLTLSANTLYILNNYFRIQSGFTITIEAGTQIQGTDGTLTTPPGTLVIERGADIVANGTAAHPIVFTSSNTSNPAPGDWGGVIILGSAPVCAGTDLAIEGLPTPNNTGLYGGTNATDNSGTMRYVVIEYAGDVIGVDNELNGLTLGGVGSGTTLEFIQVHRGLDDGFEWFGGTVNASNLVASRNGDDDFDTDFGWSGTLQFGFIVRDPDSPFLSSAPLNGSETNGDNDDCTSNFTSAQLSNITILGPFQNDGNPSSVNANYAAGVYFRDLTRQGLFNSVITGFPQGIRFTSDAGGAASNFSTTGGALDANRVDVRNTFIVAPAQGTPEITLDDATGTDFNTAFRTGVLENRDFTATNTTAGVAGSMGNILGLNNDAWNGADGTEPNPVPANGFSALVLRNPAEFSNLSSNFTTVGYVGAFGLNDNWITGWTRWQ